MNGGIRVKQLFVELAVMVSLWVVLGYAGRFILTSINMGSISGLVQSAVSVATLFLLMIMVPSMSASLASLFDAGVKSDE